MELILYRVDSNTIILVGRWRRDAMMYYLHTSVRSFTEVLALRMVQHWDYVLISSTHEGYHPHYLRQGISQPFFRDRWVT